MSHNKDIKALHQWTGKSYKECRALMKANGWDLFKASGLGELPGIFKTAREAYTALVDALIDMATGLREAINAVDWDGILREYAEIKERQQNRLEQCTAEHCTDEGCENCAGYEPIGGWL